MNKLKELKGSMCKGPGRIGYTDEVSLFYLKQLSSDEEPVCVGSGERVPLAKVLCEGTGHTVVPEQPTPVCGEPEIDDERPRKCEPYSPEAARVYIKRELPDEEWELGKLANGDISGYLYNRKQDIVYEVSRLQYWMKDCLKDWVPGSPSDFVEAYRKAHPKREPDIVMTSLHEQDGVYKVVCAKCGEDVGGVNVKDFCDMLMDAVNGIKFFCCGECRDEYRREAAEDKQTDDKVQQMLEKAGA